MIRPGVKLKKRMLPDEWMNDLIEVVVDREVNLTGRADVRFYDHKLEHFGEVAIGDEIVLSVTDDHGSSTVVFTGEVVAIEVEQVAPGAARELLLTAFDPSHRLAHEQSVKPVTKSTASDIVSFVAKAAGVSLGSVAGGRQIDYHPGRGTGLQILEGLCERYGWEWWVGTDGKLSVGDEPGGSTVEVGYLDDLPQLSVRVSGFAPDKVEVPFWDPAAQTGTHEVSSARKPSGTLARKVGKPQWSKTYVVTDDDRAGDRAEAGARATAYQRRRLAETVVATGRTGFCDPRLDLGSQVKVKQAGDLAGPFQLTSLRHVIAGGETFTEFSTGRVRPAGITDLAATAVDRTPAAPPLAVGTVTKVLPRANHGPDLGPVAVVKYAQLDAGYETNEARLLSIGGSAEHGFFIAPSVGDEVLIGYERGDLRYPVVLGGLHSVKHPAGAIAEGDNINTVRLRDGKGSDGNELLFNLDGSDGTVTLSRAGKNPDQLVMDKDRIKVTAANELVLEVGQSSITMKKDGTIEIKGNDITVTAKGNLKTKSNANTDVEATKVTVKAQTQLGLEGGAQAELKSSGITSVKGSLVQIN